MRRKTTLSEVAESAGVSVQTVSNVVNNKPIVREATRELVLRHLEKCGYRSNAMARSLKTNKSRLIGLVVPSMTNSMYAEVAESIVHEAEQCGYTVMMAVTMRDAKTELELVNTIIDHSAAGILMSPSDSAAQASQAVMKEGVPYVEMLNRGLPAGCNVFEADNCNGARQATEHLIKLGHRRIAHIGGLPNSTGTARRKGYEMALKSSGIPRRASLFEDGQYTRQGGQAACDRLLSGAEPFSAIFCASDLMAYGAIEALALQGLRIPEDISLIGFDDMNLSSLPGIDLASVSFNPAQLAKNAITQLIRIIENPAENLSLMHEVSRCTLVARSSVSKPNKTTFPN